MSCSEGDNASEPEEVDEEEEERAEEQRKGLAGEVACWKINTQISGGREGEKCRVERVLESVDVEGREKRVRMERVERSVDGVATLDPSESVNAESPFLLLEDDEDTCRCPACRDLYPDGGSSQLGSLNLSEAPPVTESEFLLLPPPRLPSPPPTPKAPAEGPPPDVARFWLVVLRRLRLIERGKRQDFEGGAVG